MIETTEGAVEYLNKRIPELEIELNRLKSIATSLTNNVKKLEANVSEELLTNVEQNAKDIADLKSIINIDGDIDLTDITKALFTANEAVDVGSKSFTCQNKGTYFVYVNSIIVPVLYDGIARTYTFTTAGVEWSVGISSDGVCSALYTIGKYVYVSFYDIAAMVKAHDANISTLGSEISAKVSSGEIIKAINDSGESSKIIDEKLAITTIVNQKADQDDLDTTINTVTQCQADILRNAHEIGLRVTQNDFETAISQKADSDKVEAIGNRVTTAEGAITVQAGLIAQKASTVDVTNLGTELRTAIDGKAGIQEFTNLQATVTTVSQTLDSQAGEIASKVSSTTYETDMEGKASVSDLNRVAGNVDSLTQRVATSETVIEQNTEDIKLKASTAQFDALNNVVASHTSSIEQNSREIGLRATIEELNALGRTVASHEASLIANSEEIEALVKENGQIKSELTVNASKIEGAVNGVARIDGDISDVRATLTTQGNQISAKLDAQGGDVGIGWFINPSGFIINKDGDALFQITPSGIKALGHLTISYGNLIMDNGAIILDSNSYGTVLPNPSSMQVGQIFFKIKS